jgi:hypothetical protein
MAEYKNKDFIFFKVGDYDKKSSPCSLLRGPSPYLFLAPPEKRKLMG